MIEKENIFEELNPLFDSPTIKPSFKKVHVVLALCVFEENKDGIGRYRLQKELEIGSGTAKSLIKKLNRDVNFITVLTDKNIRKGHILTKVGLDFVKKLKEKFHLIGDGDPLVLKEIVIKPEGNYSYLSYVRDVADKISNGIDQRDAAIKIGGVGATCLLYDGKDLIFPSLLLSQNKKEQMKVEDDVLAYISTHLNNKNLKLKKNDVIIIGLGETTEKARLAALNASLTLL
ncbi:MAG: DUF4443 domain-containing protein [Candidatus Hermodarchaeota archaeon]